MLGHVKTFSSREIPDVDLASFTQSCKDVVGTEADASSCHDDDGRYQEGPFRDSSFRG